MHGRYTIHGVEKLLRNLQGHKAPGPDGIKPRVMKRLSSQLAPILTMMCQKAYSVGDILTDWRKANVVPAYEKGTKQDPSNYRFH